ncbi:hypothetical protein ScPMuIL_001957 [Solemya velum]
MAEEKKDKNGDFESSKPMRRRRTRIASDKRIAEDEFMAAAIGDVEWLKQSLREAGGQINFDKNGLSALHLAAIHGRLECLKLLIDKYKFNINLASTTGWRAVHLCISNQTGNRALKCLQYLLNKKADASIPNNDGITPVHQAASEGHTQCLKLLIEAGSKLDCKDCRGHTPLDLAKLWGHQKCARILGGEMWHQEKDYAAKEMLQLKKVKMQQVLKEMENESEYKEAKEKINDKSFKEWLDGHNLKESCTGPKGRDMDMKIDRYPDKENIKGTKSKGYNQRSSLMKPNSMALKSGSSYKQSETSSVRFVTSELSSLSMDGSRKPTYLSFISEDLDAGLYENVRDKTPSFRDLNSTTPGFVNPNAWDYSTRAEQGEYVTDLSDDYPRDPYTLMPDVEDAPKYYDGFPLQRQKVIEIDTKKPLRKPDLPQEVIDQELSRKTRPVHRPFIFKPKHVFDTHKRKKFSEDVVGRSEVAIHVCDDYSSLLFQNSLGFGGVSFTDLLNRDKKKPISRSNSRKSLSSKSESSLDWKSKNYPREKVINTLRNISKKTHFPDIHGEEYDLNLGHAR